MLTEAEFEAIDLTVKLFNHMQSAVIGQGETRQQDLRELTYKIHAIQHSIMAQSAAREHSDRLRLLGKTIEEVVPKEEKKYFILREDLLKDDLENAFFGLHRDLHKGECLDEKGGWYKAFDSDNEYVLCAHGQPEELDLTDKNSLIDETIWFWEVCRRGKCALCKCHEDLEDCGDCPVKTKTGKPRCQDSPFSKWHKHKEEAHKDSFDPFNECPECNEIVAEIFEFLEKLKLAGVKG